MTDYSEKLPAELPPGSYREDDHPDEFAEMEIWGKFLDEARDDNRRLGEMIGSPADVKEDWQIEAWEKDLAIQPDPGDSLQTRIDRVLAARHFNPSGKTSEIQAAAATVLGYTPQIITAPPAFWLRVKGGFTAESGHYLVDDSHKFAIWIVLQAAQHSKPYNVQPCIDTISAIMPADCPNIGFWFDDNGVFDYNDFPPWPDGGDANITTS